MEIEGCCYPRCPQGDYDATEALADESEECDHEDYEADILTGRATCAMCGHSWYQTPAEIANEERRQREYAQLQERWNRKEFWHGWWLWLIGWWPLRRDDEIPF